MYSLLFSFLISQQLFQTEISSSSIAYGASALRIHRIIPPSRIYIIFIIIKLSIEFLKTKRINVIRIITLKSILRSTHDERTPIISIQRKKSPRRDCKESSEILTCMILLLDLRTFTPRKRGSDLVQKRDPPHFSRLENNRGKKLPAAKFVCVAARRDIGREGRSPRERNWTARVCHASVPPASNNRNNSRWLASGCRLTSSRLHQGV